MLQKRLHNVRFALYGIRIAWKEEFNFRVQIFAAVLALLSGWFFGISKSEWLFVIAMIGLVFTAEVFNTALEELCDKFQPEHDPHIATIKDLAAGAVLVASVVAAIIGALIFIPYIV